MVEDIISCMIPLCLKVIVHHVVDFFELGLIGSRGINWSVYLKYNIVIVWHANSAPHKMIFVSKCMQTFCGFELGTVDIHKTYAQKIGF